MKIPVYRKSLILSALFFLLSVLVFLFLYHFIQSTREESRIIASKWKTEEERRGGVRSLASFMTKIQKEKLIIDGHFVSSVNVVPLLDALEAVGLKAGVLAEVTGVALAKDQSAIIVDLRAEGSFEAIYKYTLLLENSPYEIIFNDVGMQSLPKEETNLSTKWAGIFKLKIISVQNK